jgi:hypothetical protein
MLLAVLITRRIYDDGSLLFHAPYTQNRQRINCIEKDKMQSLMIYYQDMLGIESADFLFDRTMSYCSSEDGWTLNHGAAKIFGIVTTD